MNKSNLKKRCKQFEVSYKDMTWEKPYYPIIKLGNWVCLIVLFPLIFLVSYFEEEDAQDMEGEQ